jgi:hypothetical protein
MPFDNHALRALYDLLVRIPLYWETDAPVNRDTAPTLRKAVL